HHNTGVALFSPERLTKQSEFAIYDGMKSYLDILRVGAQNIVACCEQQLGPLSFDSLVALFTAIETERSSAIKLHILKNIMLQPVTAKWLDQLEMEGYFEPYSPAECAKIYREQSTKIVAL
ncbi:MAG TPA: hypothetical protein PLD88_10265, partial [Candidatus Berkiella sp.]|nr:hypothetical protein [Candidatus Berkiella sp.]